MVYIQKLKKKDKMYYSLVEKRKTKKGWRVKTLESYGTSPPVKNSVFR
jgi:hypothetical protein